jgi:starch synthase
MTKISGPLQVLYIASEAEPYVKIGGLGDVAGSLPRALRKLAGGVNQTGSGGEDCAVDVRLVIPLYSSIFKGNFGLQPAASFEVPYAEQSITAQAYWAEAAGVPAFLVGGSPFESETPVYSGDPIQDGHKFIFFSLATLELVRLLGWRPDILHANDWHTAAAVYALATTYASDSFFKNTASLLTIHNLPYLGAGTESEMRAFGLPRADGSSLPWWAQELPMPLGLLAADQIGTVSETYSREILTPEFGSGLHQFLKTRADSITGILNGLDMEIWDPERDEQLALAYNRQTLPNRRANKTALQNEFGLKPDPEALLMAMITRMDNQKGVDLAVAALRQLALGGEAPGVGPDGGAVGSWQAIILGKGAPGLEQDALKLEADFPDRVRAVIKFDPRLSRRVYGGADALLIPSHYEPCGLTQMIAMRYGCVPLARATGGLRETIGDYGRDRQPTGILFEKAAPEELAAAIRRALNLYNKPAEWEILQQNGMQKDFSWERSARQYLELYQRLAAARQGN